MTPLAEAVIMLCVVVLSAVLVSVLIALRKTALRAESVLHVIEREIRPMVGQLESLTGELKDLSKGANAELKRISVVVRRAEDVTIKVSRLMLAVGSLTRVGQYASVAVGVKRGLDVFLTRLKRGR